MKTFILSKLEKNRESIFLLIGNAVITIFNFILISFFSHYLSVQNNATYRQLFLFIALGSALGNLGFSQSIYYQLNRLNKQYSDQNTISCGRFLLVISSIITVLIGYFSLPLFSKNFSNSEFDTIAIAGLGLLFFTIIQSADFSLYLHQKKTKRYFLIAISSVILKFAIACYLYLSGFNMKWFVYSLLLISIISYSYNLFYLRGNENLFSFSIKRKQALEQFKYALPIGLAIVAGIWMIQIDKLVLNYYLNDLRSFVVLSNGSIELPFLSTLYVSFSMIAMPSMVQAYDNGNIGLVLSERNAYIKIIASVIIPVTIALIFWSDKIIVLIFGAQYLESAPIFALFSTILFSRICSYQDIILLTGKTKYLSYIQGLELIFHFLITVFFISNFGLMGAPIASVITHYLYVIIISVISAKIIKINALQLIPLNFIIRIFSVGLICILPFFFFHRFFDVSANSFSWIIELILFLVFNYMVLLFVQNKLIK